MDHESAQLSRLEAVAVESPKSPKRRSKAMRLLQPLRKYREPKEKLVALDNAEESRFTRVLFACVSRGYHSLP